MAKDKRQSDQRTEGDFQEKLVQVNRVAKTVKGGRIMSFRLDLSWYRSFRGLQ